MGLKMFARPPKRRNWSSSKSSKMRLLICLNSLRRCSLKNYEIRSCLLASVNLKSSRGTRSRLSAARWMLRNKPNSRRPNSKINDLCPNSRSLAPLAGCRCLRAPSQELQPSSSGCTTETSCWTSTTTWQTVTTVSSSAGTTNSCRTIP